MQLLFLRSFSGLPFLIVLVTLREKSLSLIVLQQTGLAQINGRDELEIPVKAKLDGDYCKNIGLKMDVKCFLGSLHVFGKDNSVVEGGTGEIKKKERSK